MKQKEFRERIQKSYTELKKKYPDAVIFFRVGDWYYFINEDAVTAAKVLGIALIRSNLYNAQTACFPHTALDVYLPKMIRAGVRVIICDELKHINS